VCKLLEFLCSVVVGYQSFKRSKLLPTLHFILKMEAAWTSETLVFYHNTEEFVLNLHGRENITSHRTDTGLSIFCPASQFRKQICQDFNFFT
jgi:hypothetical protein